MPGRTANTPLFLDFPKVKVKGEMAGWLSRHFCVQLPVGQERIAVMLALRVGTLNQLLFGGALLLLGGVLAVDTVSLVGERNAAERTAEFSRAGKDLFGALQ